MMLKKLKLNSHCDMVAVSLNSVGMPLKIVIIVDPI